MLCFCGISSSSTFYLRVPRSGQFRPQRPLSNKWLVTQIRSKKMTRLPSFALLPPFSKKISAQSPLRAFVRIFLPDFLSFAPSKNRFLPNSKKKVYFASHRLPDLILSSFPIKHALDTWLHALNPPHLCPLLDFHGRIC